MPSNKSCGCFWLQNLGLLLDAKLNQQTNVLYRYLRRWHKLIKNYEISVYDFINAISEVVDLASPKLNNHHIRVAYLAWNMAELMGLSEQEIQDIIIASMLHDIGAFSVYDRIQINNYHEDADLFERHAIYGSKLLSNFPPMSSASRLILYHHQAYDVNRCDIPLGSYIIHLADRVTVLLDDSSEVLGQLPEVVARIEGNAKAYHPDVLEAFYKLSGMMYVWVDFFSNALSCRMFNQVESHKKITGLNALRDFARIFARIIDFRSSFTATHSCGVAAVAKELAAIEGFSKSECALMEIAGYLHDLGKLAISNEILEKPGPLSDEERICISKHTYFTYAILSKIKGLEEIACWAAFHHERENGTGYPFRLQGDTLTKLARIMAVADIFTALTEDRPYRLGIDEEEALRILVAMARDEGVDKIVVQDVCLHFRRINEVRIKAQHQARYEYQEFFSPSTSERSEPAEQKVSLPPSSKPLLRDPLSFSLSGAGITFAAG